MRQFLIQAHSENFGTGQSTTSLCTTDDNQHRCFHQIETFTKIKKKIKKPQGRSKITSEKISQNNMKWETAISYCGIELNYAMLANEKRLQSETKLHHVWHLLKFSN